MEKIEKQTRENREEIIKIYGELKLINNKLDNHVSHISSKVDLIFKFLILNILGISVFIIKSLIGI
jgi:hypothetical protein|tara:strand:+ start:62 stop:259 length:198 start_codon:yes stop_codon:yes gene_type:complete